MNDPVSGEVPSIPLWVDHRRIEYRIELENGPVVLSLPRVLTRPELADLDDFFSLVASALTRRAGAIEARTEPATEQPPAPQSTDDREDVQS